MDVFKGGSDKPEGSAERNADPTRDEAAKKGKDEVSAWLQARTESLHREKSFRKMAGDAIKIYEAQESGENSYNILYANTETLSPALYSQVPRPDCERRFKDADPLGAAVAKVADRSLVYLCDTNDEDYDTFDELMKSAVTASLVPGRGLFRWKYDEAKSADGKTYKKLCGEAIRWDRFHFGYATTWKDVPWVGFDHYMTRDEVTQNFGAPIAANLDYAKESGSEEDEGKRKSTFSDEGVGKAKLVLIFEIWDKAKGEVKFVTPSYPDDVIKRVPDPLNLTGFFPMVQPLQLIRKISTLTPTPLYEFYKQQAMELNRVSQRINKIVNQLKVRGVYDSRVGELENVLKLNDGEMTPAESMDAMDQNAKLDAAIWLMPVDKLVAVLQQLYLQRAQVKQVIFELTGIADIMRGSSAASETLGAQKIKEQWGGVRLKRMQREVARFARDNLRMMAELVFGHFDEATLKAMTGLPYPTSEEKANAKQVLDAIKQAHAQQPPAGQPPLTGQAPGGAPMPSGGAPQLPAPPPDPRVAALAPLLQMPSFGEILQLGKSDRLRTYRIDIETNSTVDLELAEDKEDVKEMLMAFTQAMQGLAPLVLNGSMPWEAAKATLMAIARRFRFGREVEEQLMAMQAPKPPDDGKVQEAQIKAQQAMAEHQLNVQTQQAEMQLEQQRFQMAQQQAAAEMQMAQQKQAGDLQLAQQKAAAEIQLARERAEAEMALAERKAIFEANLAERKADAAQKLAERNAQRDAALARDKLAKEIAAKPKPSA